MKNLCRNIGWTVCATQAQFLILFKYSTHTTENRCMTSKNGADFVRYVTPAQAPASHSGQSRNERIYDNARAKGSHSTAHRLEQWRGGGSGEIGPTGL